MQLKYLHFGQVFLLSSIDLTRGHKQVLLELETHDFIFLTTITEVTYDLAKEFATFQIIKINQSDTI